MRPSGMPDHEQARAIGGWMWKRVAVSNPVHTPRDVQNVRGMRIGLAFTPPQKKHEQRNCKKNHNAK
jgi:hypothetical protein